MRDLKTLDKDVTHLKSLKRGTNTIFFYTGKNMYMLQFAIRRKGLVYYGLS